MFLTTEPQVDEAFVIAYLSIGESVGLALELPCLKISYTKHQLILFI